MKTENRKAVIGEKILILNESPAFVQYEKYDTGVVVEVDSNGPSFLHGVSVKLDKSKQVAYLIHGEYEVIVVAQNWITPKLDIFPEINIKCGCGLNAEYAVYSHEEPHCNLCMLEAVDQAVAIPVRTLHPWEQYPTPNKGSASYMMYAYQKKGKTLPRKLKRYGCRV